MARIGYHLLALLGWVLFAFCFVVPLLAACADLLHTPDWSEAGLGPRRLGLIWNGLLIAAASAIAAQIPGTLLAAGLCAGGWTKAVTRWVSLFVLLTPPYVFVYAWSLPLLPGGTASFALTQHTWLTSLGTYARAIVCLSCWSAPLAAFLLSAAWNRTGRQAYRLALLDSAPIAALLQAGWPAMRLWVGLSVSVIGAIAITEYSVPHLCMVQTWNTEVLAQIQSAGPNGRALLLAWPLLVLVGLIGVAWLPMRRRIMPLLLEMGRSSDVDTGSDGKPSERNRAAVIAAAAGILLLLSPFAVLVSWLQSPSKLFHFPSTTRDIWVGAITWALVSGILTIPIAALVIGERPATSHQGKPARFAAALQTLVISVVLLFAIAPPALVGDAFVAGYLRWRWIHDHGIIVSLVGAARFAFIPLLVAWLSARAREVDADELAQTDRAAPAERFWHVTVPQCIRPVMGAALMVFLFSLGELAAVQLVYPAGVGSIAITLLNQIHFGRNDEIIAMCLHVGLLVAIASLAALGLSRAGRSARRI